MNNAVNFYNENKNAVKQFLAENGGYKTIDGNFEYEMITSFSNAAKSQD